MRLRCLSPMPEEGKGGTCPGLGPAEVKAHLDMQQKYLQPLATLYELSELRFACQNGRCQGRCGQKLTVSGRAGIAVEWLTL